MFPRHAIALSSLFIGLAVAALPRTALSGTLQKSLMTSPANVCTGALPSYEGAIRKRPLAVANEGTETAFVTCGSAWFKDESNASYSIEMNFRNRNSSQVSFTCTGVNGSETSGVTVYVPKTIVVPGLGTSLDVWFSSDGISTDRPFSVSCALPPNVSIGNMYVSGPIEVGA